MVRRTDRNRAEKTVPHDPEDKTEPCAEVKI